MASWYGAYEVLIRKKGGFKGKDDVCILLILFTFEAGFKRPVLTRMGGV